MAATTVERMRQILGSSTNLIDKFMVLSQIEILENLIPGKTDEILESFLGRVPAVQVKLFGRKIGDYSGLTRTEIKANFTEEDGTTALTDADVDQIFLALYGTTTPLLGGVAPSASPTPSGAKAEDKPKSEPAKTVTKQETKSKDAK